MEIKIILNKCYKGTRYKRDSILINYYYIKKMIFLRKKKYDLSDFLKKVSYKRIETLKSCLACWQGQNPLHAMSFWAFAAKSSISVKNI
jgi:hypothetical protein